MQIIKLSHELKNTKGTYIIFTCLKTEKYIRIGKLGTFCFYPGYYGYVGSAFGPGGISSRVGHHLHTASEPHWHMDYFRKEILIEEIWICNDEKPLEHVFADLFLRMVGTSIPVKGFGSSDCRCVSHLFYFQRVPDAIEFEKKLGQEGIMCRVSVLSLWNESTEVFQDSG